jgi:hypothetical protein
VFPSRVGTPADASHVRRSFRTVAAAGLDPHEWTPRELRHSFVSLLSDADVPIEHIARLVGHSSTTTIETIYGKQIRPVIVHGADVMDRIFPGEMNRMRSHSDCHSVLVSNRLGVSHVPSELVGVAGFEPAASSSRSQRAMRPTTPLSLPDLPCTVRGRPLASAGVCGGCYSFGYSPTQWRWEPAVVAVTVAVPPARAPPRPQPTAQTAAGC